MAIDLLRKKIPALLVLLFFTALSGRTYAQPPVITVQPHNTTVCTVQTTQFTVTATNNPTYQWQASYTSNYWYPVNTFLINRSGDNTNTLTLSGNTDTPEQTLFPLPTIQYGWDR